MAYTILKSNGTVLTTIPDGTINTTSTSLGLPGRNFAGYGQAVDENLVYLVENFARSTPPANPLTGQLWYNTNNGTLNVCPASGTTNPSLWVTLASTSSTGNTSFGNVTVTGGLQASSINVTGAITANSATLSYLTVGANAAIANLTATNANIGTLTATNITTGSTANSGTLTGVWTINGTGIANGINGTSTWITGGNLVVGGVGSPIGIRTDGYYYANGTPINFAGTYGNANVAVYLPTFSGIVGNADASATFRGSTITTGSSANSGSITGNWALTAGSRIIATYADLAERFAADDVYDAGTVVSLGGDAEITAVQFELSEDVFGVISNTAAYLMNGMAGSDDTHPAVAVSGRVPVKVVGVVKKGDRLVSAGAGLARAAASGEASFFNVIGRALEDKTNTSVGFVEAFVTIK